LKPAGIILFDKAPQTFMDHVPDLHGQVYQTGLFGVK
jgi:hypothetical protein